MTPLSTCCEGSYILRLSVWTVLTGSSRALGRPYSLQHADQRLSKLALTMERTTIFSEEAGYYRRTFFLTGNSDEIDRLRTTFSRMVQRISAKRLLLKQTDVLRRSWWPTCRT